MYCSTPPKTIKRLVEMHGDSWVKRLQTLKDDSRDNDPLAAIAVAGILASDADESIKPELREKRRVVILQEFADLVDLENNRGFTKTLLLSILEQKIEYLLKATSAAQIKEICKPQYPGYDKDGKLTNAHPYPILEEEAIGWALAIFKYPPTGPQTDRLAYVLREVSKRHPDDPSVKDWNKQLDAIFEDPVY